MNHYLPFTTCLSGKMPSNLSLNLWCQTLFYSRCWPYYWLVCLLWLVLENINTMSICSLGQTWHNHLHYLHGSFVNHLHFNVFAHPHQDWIFLLKALSLWSRVESEWNILFLSASQASSVMTSDWTVQAENWTNLSYPEQNRTTCYELNYFKGLKAMCLWKCKWMMMEVHGPWRCSKDSRISFWFWLQMGNTPSTIWQLIFHIVILVSATLHIVGGDLWSTIELP